MAPPDWASLPSDLVRRVADIFLDTSDVDYYISLRAACRSWRAATDDPRVPDPRFSPQGWIMVASLAGDDHSGRRCLFLHVNNGRLLWKDQPMLRSYTVAASTEDGHLVLEPASRNARICLLNPIASHLVRFLVTTTQFLMGDKFGLRLGRKMFGAGTSPMVLYSHFDNVCGGCIDPTGDVVYNQESLFRVNPALGMFAAMVPFKGRAYVLYKSGSVAVVEHNCRMDEKPVVTTVITNEWDWMYHRGVFLVDNAGELLLVRYLGSEELLVFRVDVENRVLKQIKSIGNRAIFLVSNSVFPSILIISQPLNATASTTSVIALAAGFACIASTTAAIWNSLSPPSGGSTQRWRYSVPIALQEFSWSMLAMALCNDNP